jgi:sodium-dependent dicarboxylate transporter 2/3/5
MQKQSSILSKFTFILFILAPIIAIYVIIKQPLSASYTANAMLGVAIWMAIWWATEKVPLSITALLPVVMFPLLGIMDGKEVSSTYYNHIIFLFIGGFMLALGMQHWKLHKRIALKILMLTGTSPSKILLGFMLATAFLSMWISNTATTMMMLPILLSVIMSLEEMFDKKAIQQYSIALLLGTAYSSSIGGIATLIGTPPNPIFVRIYAINFPQAAEISFSQWMIFALPVGIIMFVLVYALLYFMFVVKQNKIWGNKPSPVDFSMEYSKLGKSSYEEKWMLVLFISAALLWMTRSPLEIGSFNFKGWASLFPWPKYFNDGTVAMLIGILLFLIPSKTEKGEKLLNWIKMRELPWNIIVLFGGGFALAEGFKTSGLSEYIGVSLESFTHIHPLLLILLVTGIMVFLTEFTSNSASTTMLLPILASLAVSAHIHPLMIMIPATIAASMAFMLPVATPPNAIIFSSKRLHIKDMMRVGFFVNLIAIMVISLMSYYLLPLVFVVE